MNELDKIGKTAKDPASPARFTAAATRIAVLVGVHDATALAAHAAPYRVFHDPGQYVSVQGRNFNDTSIDYHYVIDAKAYKSVVTDTRTWRSFPEPGLDTHPSLIEAGMMGTQLGPKDLDSRLLIVVVTTNFPPIATIGFAARQPRVVGLYEHDLYDSWELPSLAFDQMIVEITKLFPPAEAEAIYYSQYPESAMSV